MAGHFVHNGLPGAHAQSRVMRGQISASKGKIESGLLVRFVHRQNQSLDFGAVFRFQASSFGCSILLPVENASSALVKTVFELHDLRWVQGCTRQRSDRYGGVSEL